MLDISNRQELEFNKEVIERVVSRLAGADCEVSVSIVTNNEIQQLNALYRGIDAPTDVLSFPMDEIVLGDIVISMEKVIEQAEEFGHSVERELGFLTAHGILHLLGYDHENTDDEAEMFAMQEQVLEELGLFRGRG